MYGLGLGALFTITGPAGWIGLPLMIGGIVGSISSNKETLLKHHYVYNKTR